MDAETLRQAFDHGRRAWPGLDVGFEVFSSHLQAVLGEDPDWDWLPQAGDLYLACACATGHEPARDSLRQLLPKLEKAISRIDSDRQFVDGIMRSVDEELLVNGGIARYAGQRPVLVWMTVRAARIALGVIKKRKQEPSPSGGTEGRSGSKLDGMREAIAYCRELAVSDPVTFKPRLAAGLAVLGDALQRAGRSDEAIDAAREASELYRQLAAPGGTGFGPDFFRSLCALEHQLRAVGRFDEALSLMKERRAVYRDVADAGEVERIESLTPSAFAREAME